MRIIFASYLIVFSLMFLLQGNELTAQNDQSLVTSSFFGGEGFDWFSTAAKLSVPLGNGEWVMLGTSGFSTLPTGPDAFQYDNPGMLSSVIVNLNVEGMPYNVSYLGSSASDTPSGIIHTGDHLILSGHTKGSDYPVTEGAHNTVFAGSDMGFLTCFDSSAELCWSTLVGGSSSDVTTALAHHGDESIYLSGVTNSPGMATPDAHLDSLYSPDFGSAFLTRYNSDGLQEWFTYYYHAEGEFRNIRRIEVSSLGDRLYVGGITEGNSPLDPGAHQSEYGGGSGMPWGDAFLAAFSTSDGSLLWETYYGGENDDSLMGMAVDSEGVVYISGFTSSTQNIATTGAWQDELPGSSAAFLAAFSPEGERLWATYFGSSSGQGVSDISLHGDHLLLVGNAQQGSDIAIGQPLESEIQGDVATFISKWDLMGNPIWCTYANVGPFCGPSNIVSISAERFAITGVGPMECANSSFMDANGWQPNFGGGDGDIWYAVYDDNTLSTTATSVLDWALFPNPASNALTLQSSEPAPGHYTMYDLLGKVVMQGHTMGTRTELSIAHLPKGLYLLRYEAEGQAAAGKLVVE
jgi:hypothetical protein